MKKKNWLLVISYWLLVSGLISGQYVQRYDIGIYRGDKKAVTLPLVAGNHSARTLRFVVKADAQLTTARLIEKVSTDTLQLKATYITASSKTQLILYFQRNDTWDLIAQTYLYDVLSVNPSDTTDAYYVMRGNFVLYPSVQSPFDNTTLPSTAARYLPIFASNFDDGEFIRKSGTGYVGDSLLAFLKKSDTTSTVPTKIFLSQNYYSKSAADILLGAKVNSSDSVTKFVTPQSFISEFDTRLGVKTTTNLAEGNNLYYTDVRSRNATGWKLGTNKIYPLTAGDKIHIRTNPEDSTLGRGLFNVYGDVWINRAMIRVDSLKYSMWMGTLAGRDHTTGEAVTTYGDRNAFHATTASWIVSFGSHNLWNLLNGNRDVAVGHDVFFNYNGSQSTGIGIDVGLYLLSGDNNSLGGMYSGTLVNGDTLKIANKLTLWGAYSTSSKNNITNASGFGYGVVVDKDNQVVMGDNNVVQTLLKGFVNIKNQTTIPNVETDNTSIYPYDDMSNVKILATKDDSGAETTTQILTVDQWAGIPSAYQFDGIDDYVRVPNNANFNFGTGNFTLSYCGYLDPANYGSTNKTLLRAIDTDGYWIYFPDATTLRVKIAAVSKDISTATLGIDVAKYFKLDFTRSGDNLKIFVNGILRSTQTGFSAASATPGPSAVDLYINFGGAAGRYLASNIVFVKFYNRTLTQAESSSQLNNGRPGSYQIDYKDRGANQSIVATYDTTAAYDSTITLSYGKNYLWTKGNADSLKVGTTKYTSSTEFIYTTGSVYAFGDLTNSGIKPIGCTLDLRPENAGRKGWIDGSGNQLSGYTVGSPICLHTESRPSPYRDIGKLIPPSATALTNIVPRGYLIKEIRAKGTASLTGVKIGTTSGGEEIVASSTAGTTAMPLTLAATVKAGYSETADQTLYVQHSTSGQTLDIIIEMEKVGN